MCTEHNDGLYENKFRFRTNKIHKQLQQIHTHSRTTYNFKSAKTYQSQRSTVM